MPRVNIPEEILPPEGEYLARVISVTEKKTKAGDDMWGVTLELVEDGEFCGQQVEDNIVFSAAALKRLRIVAKAFGLPLPLDNIEPDDIMGKLVMITTEHDEYKGETKSKVVFSGYRQAPVKSDPVADKFKGRAVGGFEPVREPGEDKEPLPEHDEPPFPPEDLPF